MEDRDNKRKYENCINRSVGNHKTSKRAKKIIILRNRICIILGGAVVVAGISAAAINIHNSVKTRQFNNEFNNTISVQTTNEYLSPNKDVWEDYSLDINRISYDYTGMAINFYDNLTKSEDSYNRENAMKEIYLCFDNFSKEGNKYGAEVHEATEINKLLSEIKSKYSSDAIIASLPNNINEFALEVNAIKDNGEIDYNMLNENFKNIIIAEEELGLGAR